MNGVFGLDSPVDLFKKLESDFAQLMGEPNNPYHAYNFFVTAWHLLDWKYPKESDIPTRNNVRDRTPLLQICEHLAVGAKHFEVRDERLKTLSIVSDSRHSSVWADGLWAPGCQEIW